MCAVPETHGVKRVREVLYSLTVPAAQHGSL